jgi:hypothetical protein
MVITRCLSCQTWFDAEIRPENHQNWNKDIDVWNLTISIRFTLSNRLHKNPLWQILKKCFLSIVISAGSNEVVSALIQQKEQIDEITAEAGATHDSLDLEYIYAAAKTKLYTKQKWCVHFISSTLFLHLDLDLACKLLKPCRTATYSHYEKLFGMAQHDTANLETAVKLYDDTFQVNHIFHSTGELAWVFLKKTIILYKSRPMIDHKKISKSCSSGMRCASGRTLLQIGNTRSCRRVDISQMLEFSRCIVYLILLVQRNVGLDSLVDVCDNAGMCYFLDDSGHDSGLFFIKSRGNRKGDSGSSQGLLQLQRNLPRIEWPNLIVPQNEIAGSIPYV